MESLIGTYECKTDSKGRVMMAAGLKKQLESVVHEGFVLKRSVFQPCLELYPMQEWKKVMGQVSKLNRFVKKNNDFIRLFTAGVKNVELDASGRLLLPKDLLVYSKIGKEVVFSSAVSIIEIWDKQLYEDAIEGAMDDFAELAEQVMGGLNTEENELS
ncbi:division/cell wall cluster transcriptional repressor MraZ [Wenyingzhuangia sp. 2_MG-2023]|uniref:division/cell wall cluster transcriptional repressor MraZ n=1 Tax=Wenyingzhuangia sp. 2_MG-2023 TaxID=3062639 RepID=UPI0026E3CA8D|nr:division/cell wall cluster transcriptional repressor MraZ [Wenyingzhuangia sp. 2_MG-2023]MDO6737700.1 division/cell wall cluster transcriptional repressor MraZ [Wenyingzhuangia sp. 2_MG-2023]